MSDAIREAFEKWWLIEMGHSIHDQRSGDGYFPSDADASWEAWKAALQSQTAPAVPGASYGLHHVSRMYQVMRTHDSTIDDVALDSMRDTLRHVLTTPQPDHSPDAGKVVQGKNRYGLDMGYFSRLIAREFGDLSNFRPDEFARVCARMAATADASVLQEEEFRRTPAGDGGEVGPVGWIWDAYGQRNFTAGTHHKNVLEADGVTLTPVYTHPAESREEIQAQALEKFEEKLLKAAHPLLKHWAVRLCQSEAARLRASQQEGGEA